MSGLRWNANKTPLEWLPVEALTEVAGVMHFAATNIRKDGTTCEGRKMYPKDNWRQGLSWRATVGSLLRHAFARLRGETCDPESGYLHSAHMACNALFLCNFELLGTGTDDFYRKPSAAGEGVAGGEGGVVFHPGDLGKVGNGESSAPQPQCFIDGRGGAVHQGIAIARVTEPHDANWAMAQMQVGHSVARDDQGYFMCTRAGVVTYYTDGRSLLIGQLSKFLAAYASEPACWKVVE